MELLKLRANTSVAREYTAAALIVEDAIARDKGPETRIIVTQPRRIAAVSVAERVAAERNESTGNSVGFSVRLHGQKPRNDGGAVVRAGLV